MFIVSNLIKRLEVMVESHKTLVERGGKPSLESIRITNSYAQGIKKRFSDKKTSEMVNQLTSQLIKDESQLPV